MNWRGTPFNFLENDTINQTFLNISHLPVLALKTDFAYDTFFSSILAGLFPAVVAIWAMRSNSNNINAERLHQQQLANKTITAQIVAASRQVWINDLRESAAQYIGSITADFNCLNILAEEYEVHGYYSEGFRKVLGQERTVKSNLGLLMTKIILLLNPDEEDSRKVLLAMENLREFLNQNNNDNGCVFLQYEDLKTLTDEFRLSIYKIVKNEWDDLKRTI